MSSRIVLHFRPCLTSRVFQQRSTFGERAALRTIFLLLQRFSSEHFQGKSLFFFHFVNNFRDDSREDSNLFTTDINYHYRLLLNDEKG